MSEIDQRKQLARLLAKLYVGGVDAVMAVGISHPAMAKLAATLHETYQFVSESAPDAATREKIVCLESQ